MPNLEHPIFEILGRPRYGPYTETPGTPGIIDLSLLHGDLVKIQGQIDGFVPLPWDWDREALINGTKFDYEIRTYSLTSAQTDLEIVMQGNVVAVWTDGAISGLSLRANHPTASSIPLRAFVPLAVRFWKLYLTNNAQAGKTLWVFVGRNASAAALGGLSSGGGTAVDQHFYSLRTDKDTHFTGAIVQNATEEENVTGLVANKIRIVGVMLQSDQQLDYRLALFNTDGFADADLDLDTMTAEIEIDLPSYGWRIAGAGQYYMTVSGLAIDYQDDDATNELHVALQNLSATSKNAGATGEVVVKFIYEERF